MHKDEIKGAGKDAKGAMKRSVGRATGDERLMAEGDMDSAKGKVQKGVGSLKEGARRALKN